MSETELELSLPARQLRALVAAVFAAAWSDSATDAMKVAACDLFAAYCRATGANPSHIAESLPYSVDLHSKLFSRPIGVTVPEDGAGDV